MYRTSIASYSTTTSALSCFVPNSSISFGWTIALAGSCDWLVDDLGRHRWCRPLRVELRVVAWCGSQYVFARPLMEGDRGVVVPRSS